MNKRTYVGLDVHARSVKGCAIDCETGEILRQSLTANDAGTVEWVSGLPGPVLVVYEAGPTGFGLARTLTGAGLECQVAAPSKLHVRGPGVDRCPRCRASGPVGPARTDHARAGSRALG
jgi:transposase